MKVGITKLSKKDKNLSIVTTDSLVLLLAHVSWVRSVSEALRLLITIKISMNVVFKFKLRVRLLQLI